MCDRPMPSNTTRWRLELPTVGELARVAEFYFARTETSPILAAGVRRDPHQPNLDQQVHRALLRAASI